MPGKTPAGRDLLWGCRRSSKKQPGELGRPSRAATIELDSPGKEKGEKAPKASSAAVKSAGDVEVQKLGTTKKPQDEGKKCEAAGGGRRP